MPLVHACMCLVLCVRLLDRRLLGLELTAEPVSHWLIGPMWQTGRKTIQICKSLKPSVGQGYYLGPVSVWAECHLGYTVFHLSSQRQLLSLLDYLLLLAKMFSAVLADKSFIQEMILKEKRLLNHNNNNTILPVCLKVFSTQILSVNEWID